MERHDQVNYNKQHQSAITSQVSSQSQPQLQKSRSANDYQYNQKQANKQQKSVMIDNTLDSSTSDASISSSQYDGGQDIYDESVKPTIPIEFKFKQKELEARFIKMIKNTKMMIRERLKIGDLAFVLGDQMKLPKFIKLNLSFQLEGMKFPISFPKSKRMYKVSKHLQSLHKVREQLHSNVVTNDSQILQQNSNDQKFSDTISTHSQQQQQQSQRQQQQHRLIYIIIEAQKRQGYEHEKIDKMECCEQQ